MDRIPLPFSVVKILSQDDAALAVAKEPKKWNVVSIWSGGGGKHGFAQPDFRGDELSLCQQRFHDITSISDPQHILCDEKHLQQILEFARARYHEPLIVHCFAGIARSSAITFCILLDYYKDKSNNPIDDALQTLVGIKNASLIQPNSYIVRLGVNYIAANQYQAKRWLNLLHENATYRRFYPHGLFSI